ncbi:MAG: RNA polymerase factor sigma-54 [Spirochaetes bacterium]|nr:RNA polymerase factor sigma-54 [Spirochaetota bacterium]
MAQTIKLDQKQTQKLILTQTQRQALELLQLSNLELLERITKELEENPVLEEETIVSIPTTITDESTLIASVNQVLSGIEDIKPDYENVIEVSGESSEDLVGTTSDDARKRNFIENVVYERQSLTEHLLSQARVASQNDEELRLLELVITSLDENGFLPIDARTLAKASGEPQERIENAIKTVQLFDPLGCAAQNAQESLLIQARHRFPEDRYLIQLISNHLRDLEQMKYSRIAKSLNVNEDFVYQKCKLLQTLNPYPGKQYKQSSIKYIIPDIEVKYVDGEIIINVNDDWIPTLKINSYYNELLRKKNIEKNLKEFIQNKLQLARSLVKNIQNRKATILKVVSAIMQHQHDFLIKGPGHLKPLVQSKIAHQVGMHESTISRVTSNKFVQTPWGVFELKYFFTNKVKSTQSDQHSSEEVLALIKDIIAREDPLHPLSDEEILNRLKKSGIEISRRTIAKYRRMLHIPPSHIRKRQNFLKGR